MLQQVARGIQFLTLALFSVNLAVADEPIVLRYKLEKGATLITQSKMGNKTIQTVMGNNVETTISATSIDVRTIDDLVDGTAKMKSKTERFSGTIKIPTLGEFVFDSKKPDRDKSSVLGAALTPLYERLVGSELQLEVTPRGTVKNLTGYAQLVGDLIKDNPLTAQFASGGSDNAAKMSAQGQWLVFPENGVKVGEKWENPLEIELSGLGVLKGKETITLLSIESRDGHSVAKLSTSTDISFDLKVDMGVAKVSGKVTTANSMGSAEFDITAGKLLKQNAELTLSGELSVEVNNTTVPVQMTQTISSEQVALDKLPE